MSVSSRWPTAYVLGLSPNGLAIVRDLARQGVPVVALEDNPKAPALATRYARIELVPSLTKHPEAWVERLVGLGHGAGTTGHGAGGGGRGVVFPTGDVYALFLSKHRKQLEPFFSLVIPSDEIVRTLPDKRRFHELAERLGIPVARTFFPQTVAELSALDGAVPFPCAVKPIHSHRWAREPRNPHRTKKLIPVRNGDELRDVFQELIGYGLDMMVQELIPGDMTRLYGFVAYFDQQGELRAWYLMHKIRQWPVDFGLAALAVTTAAPDAAALGERLLRGMAYRGIGHVELKRDARDERWVVIEANTRPILFGSLGTAAGVNLPYLAYRELIGRPLPPARPYRVGVKWLDLQADVQSALVLRQQGRLTWWQWGWSLLTGPKAYAVFAWDDLGPWWIAMRTLIWRLRHRRFDVQRERVVPFPL